MESTRSQFLRSGLGGTESAAEEGEGALEGGVQGAGEVAGEAAEVAFDGVVAALGGATEVAEAGGRHRGGPLGVASGDAFRRAVSRSISAMRRASSASYSVKSRSCAVQMRTKSDFFTLAAAGMVHLPFQIV
ncbi:hypothetical protein JW905_05220, partial [bacterium]|nr:hypothetical protein [candidate division CSSED10-310 bacterium]